MSDERKPDDELIISPSYHALHLVDPSVLEMQTMLQQMLVAWLNTQAIPPFNIKDYKSPK
jgi:hypothetical protein